MFESVTVTGAADLVEVRPLFMTLFGVITAKEPFVSPS